MSKGRQIKLEGSDEILTHREVLQLLSEQARKGSITAAVSLERALRNAEPPDDEIDAVLDRILSKEDD